MLHMPFGRYKGRYLTEVPSSYLCWVLRECRDLDVCLEDAIRFELDRRHPFKRGRERPRGTTPGEAPPGSDPVLDLPAVITRWYRDLCLRWHPDRGGSTEAMQAVNDAHDRLRKLVG